MNIKTFAPKEAVSSVKEEIASAIVNDLKSVGISGNVATVIGELVTGVVMMFIGLFMVNSVSTATAINASSAFYSIYTALISTTGTIFSVLGLVIIVIALGTAMGVMKQSVG